MEFTYRGINYKYNPPTLELITGETGGKYRGTDWNRHYLRHIPVPQPVANLQYRGVNHCVGHPVDVEASLLRQQHEELATVTQKQAIEQPKAKSRQEVMDELNNTHLNNIRRNLEHRIQIAKAKGDRHLVQMLEAEVEQIA